MYCSISSSFVCFQSVLYIANKAVRDILILSCIRYLFFGSLIAAGSKRSVRRTCAWTAIIMARIIGVALLVTVSP